MCVQHLAPGLPYSWSSAHSVINSDDKRTEWARDGTQRGEREEGSEAEKSDTRAARLLCVSGQSTYSQKSSPLEGGGDGGT